MLGQLVLDSDETVQYLQSNDIVLMRADMTSVHPTAHALLTMLGREDGGLPFLALFPARRLSEAHTLQDYNPFHSDAYRRNLRKLVSRIDDLPEPLIRTASKRR